MHFRAFCRRYPEFSLTVAALRPLMKERGDEMSAPVAHFHNGYFDSEDAGFSEEEAALIQKAIEGCVHMPPLYGTDLYLVSKEQFIADMKRMADTPAAPVKQKEVALHL